MREGKEFVGQQDYPRAILQFKNASAAMPQDPEPYYQLGLMATAMGDTQSAGTFLNRAIALNPKHLDAIIALAGLMTHSAQRSSFEQATRLANDALRISPGNIKALNVIALANLRIGQTKTATGQLEELLKRAPNDVETIINLARARLTLDDRIGAEELLQREASNSTPEPQAVFALADFYNVIGDLPKSEEWYARGLKIQPGNAQALAALGRLQVRAGKNREADSTFSQLAQNPDHRYRYALAVRLLTDGRKDAAIAEFERIFRENQDDREARTRLIEAYLDLGRTAGADQLLNKALKADAQDVDALQQRARLHLLRGEIEDAERDLNLVQQYRPESPGVHYLKAQVYRSRQKEQLQINELSAALRLEPAYTRARIELSAALIRTSPQRALDVLESAPEEQKEVQGLRRQRIWPLIELNRSAEARVAIDVLLASGDPEARLQDAVLRMKQRDFAGAFASAQKALATNPSDLRALEIIVRSAVGQKQPAQGIEAVRRHAAQNRNLTAVQMFLGHLELQAGNTAQARSAFEAAKVAAPGSLDADWSLIDLALVEHKLDDARQRIMPLLNGPTEPAARARLAVVEQMGGNPKAASDQYRKILEAKPFDAEALNNLSYILSEYLGNPSEGLRLIQTAKELEPNSAAVDDTMGWAYYRLGRYGDAVHHLELAVKHAPNARRQAHLAMAYARQGDRTRAKQSLQTALKLDPALPEASLAQKIVAEAVPPAQNR